MQRSFFTQGLIFEEKSAGANFVSVNNHENHRALLIVKSRILKVKNYYIKSPNRKENY
jgi:hypothetical protein